MRIAVRGVNSEGLRTMQLPVANAGPNFHDIISTLFGSLSVCLGRLEKLILTGEVPWDNLANNTNGFVAGVGELVLGRFDGLALDFICPTGVILDRCDRISNVDGLGPTEGLAIVQSLDGRKFLKVLLHEVSELVEEGTALSSRAVKTPNCVECLLGGRNGDVNILLGTR